MIHVLGADGLLGTEVSKKLHDKGVNHKRLVRRIRENNKNNAYIECGNIATYDFGKITNWPEIMIDFTWCDPRAEAWQQEKSFEASCRVIDRYLEQDIEILYGVGTCLEIKAEEIMTKNKEANLRDYVEKKIKLQEYLATKCEKKGAKWGWFRPHYIYSKDEKRSKLVKYIHSQIRRGGKVVLKTPNLVREFISVEEASIQITANIMSKNQGVQDITSGDPISVYMFTKLIIRSLGSDTEVVYDDEYEKHEEHCVKSVKSFK